MLQLILFFLLAFVAEVLGTVGGFGSSLFFVPIAAYFFDFHTVLGITALFHVVSNLTKMAFFRRGINKSLLINLGIPAVLTVVLGAWISQWVKTDALEIGLAVFLMGISLFFLIGKKVVIQPTISNSIVGGVLSGFFAGLLGTGGAIRGITLTAFALTSEAFIATSAVIDLAIDASRSVVYALNGYVLIENLYLIPGLLGISIAGTFAGKKILARMSEEQFKSGVLFLILLTGIVTLVKTLA